MLRLSRFPEKAQKSAKSYRGRQNRWRSCSAQAIFFGHFFRRKIGWGE